MNLKEFIDKNGYYLKTSIDWEWDRYLNNTPSVTTILKLIGDPGFDFVMSKYSDQVEAAALRGTGVHDTAENFYKGNIVVTDNKEEAIKLNPNISKFHALFVKQILGMETRYELDGISGKIDLEALVNIRGLEYEANIDYKNAKIKSEKYKVQCGGYEYLNGRPGILVYVGNKLDVVQVDSFYKDIFIELKDYFLTLLNGQQ